MIARELAWRVFAAEYNQSRLEIKGEGERAPSYIVSPLGAMINRLFVVGVLTDKENIGSEDEPLWRARLSDPTGTFYVSSGQYQPEATASLAKIEPPAFVAIVGKVRTYSPEEGKLYVSIRPERIAEVDSRQRDLWVLETCKSTLRRVEAMAAAEEMKEPSADEIAKLGYPGPLAEGIAKATGFYTDLDLSRYRALVIDALKFLLPEYQGETEGEMPEQLGRTEEEVPDEDETQAEEDKEEKVLAVITSLDRSGKGASWDEIVDEVRKVGIDKAELEELTNSLMDKGMIYEPVLGKMKRI